MKKILEIPASTLLCRSAVTPCTAPSVAQEANWLDIFSFALTKQHQKSLLVQVILGEHKYVNVEVPRAIADLSCYNYKTSLVRWGSFKCHNWA